VIESSSGVHVASVTTCVNAGTVKERVHGSIYTRFRHGILDLAVEGWVSTMIALDSSSSKSNESDTEELRHRVREINPSCLLARTNRGYMSADTVNTILNKAPFQQPSMHERRQLHLFSGWEYMKIPLAKSGTKSFSVKLSGGEISAVRLQIILSRIFPTATVRFPAQTLKQPSVSVSGNSFGITRLWELAQAKKCGERAHAVRVSEIEKLSRALGSCLETCSIHGEVVIGDKIVAVEGSASSISVVLSKAAVETSYLTFNSNQLNESTCEQLRELLLLSVGELPPYQPVRTRDSLSKLEVDSIIKSRSRLPLPDGWLFDGNSYCNFDGRRLAERPDKERLLSDWLEEENAKLAFWCNTRS
jgi:hypothetical protein